MSGIFPNPGRRGDSWSRPSRPSLASTPDSTGLATSSQKTAKGSRVPAPSGSGQRSLFTGDRSSTGSAHHRSGAAGHRYDGVEPKGMRPFSSGQADRGPERRNNSAQATQAWSNPSTMDNGIERHEIDTGYTPSKSPLFTSDGLISVEMVNRYVRHGISEYLESEAKRGSGSLKLSEQQRSILQSRTFDVLPNQQCSEEDGGKPGVTSYFRDYVLAPRLQQTLSDSAYANDDAANIDIWFDFFQCVPNAADSILEWAESRGETSAPWQSVNGRLRGCIIQDARYVWFQEFEDQRRQYDEDCANASSAPELAGVRRQLCETTGFDVLQSSS